MNRPSRARCDSDTADSESIIADCERMRDSLGAGEDKGTGKGVHDHVIQNGRLQARATEPELPCRAAAGRAVTVDRMEKATAVQ